MSIDERTVPPVALLVDGENISPKWADRILKIVKDYGAPTVRRVYGKAELIAEWAEYGFRLQATRPGKNSADLLLTVEAMSLALRDAFATIIVVSSDSDFSYLAEHLRELGHHFIGVGETKAALAFQAACSEFINLNEAAPAKVVKALAQENRQPATKIIPLVRGILPRSSLKGGWAYVDWVEKTLRAADPDFSPAVFGHEALADLLKSVNFFELDVGPNGKPRVRERTANAGLPQPANP